MTKERVWDNSWKGFDNSLWAANYIRVHKSKPLPILEDVAQL